MSVFRFPLVDNSVDMARADVAKHAAGLTEGEKGLFYSYLLGAIAEDMEMHVQAKWPAEQPESEEASHG